MSLASENNFPSSLNYRTTISNSPANGGDYRFSNVSFVSDSGNYLKESFKLNKDSLICSKITFVSENNWLEASFCVICSTVFDKLKANFRHHCRLCGGSVCGLCSKKKINEKRVCDLCFLRVESQDLIERKEKMLEMKEQTCKDLEITIKVTKDRLNKVFDEIQSQKTINITSEKENHSKLDSSKAILTQTKDLLLKSNENLKKVKENMLKVVEHKSKKTEEFDKYLKRNKDLAVEIEKKEFSKQTKIEELENLLNQISKTKTTKSYADIYEFLEVNDDLLSLHLDNNSKSESLDELSSFVHKMRKSLAKKSVKKSLMMKHSLLKNPDKYKIKNRENKGTLNQAGLCCGGNDCKLF